MLTVLPLLLLAPQGLSATEHEISELLGDRWAVEAEVYSQAGPAVVSIELEGIVRQRDFFGRSRKQEGQLGQGTGVVIDSTGLVITNAHVAAPEGPGIEVQKIWVSFAEEFGGARLEAKLLNAAPEWDLALLKIEAPGPFRSVPLGSSKGLLKGEKVIAIGTPFGNDHSITSGILSGYHRNITVRTPSGSKEMPGLLQTDAAINPGNSGGPLLNSLGELVGINSATMEAADGIGFAIPVDRVSEILSDRLLDVDHSTRFWSGMKVQEENGQLVVASVNPRGPAAKAGIEIGDVILEVEGQTVPDKRTYAGQVLPLSEGTKVELTVRNKNKMRNATITLASSRERDTRGLLGFDARRSLIYVRERGRRRGVTVLEITQVFPDSRAEELGLIPGDRIAAVKATRPDGKTDWIYPDSLSELIAIVRGPDFIRDGENIWILREDSSFRGSLLLEGA